MSFVLFVLGLAAAAAGVLMIGFGIPINEFSLGNTLIIAGTTALASGLVVIGLSVVARQLSKIADLLLTRPAGPASGRSSDMLEQGGGGGRMPAPRSAAHPADAAPPRNPAPSPELRCQHDPIEDVPRASATRAAAAHPRFRCAAGAARASASRRAHAASRLASARRSPRATPPIEPSVRQEPSRVRNRRLESPNERPVRPSRSRPSTRSGRPTAAPTASIRSRTFRPSRRRRRSRRGSMAMPPASASRRALRPAR